MPTARLFAASGSRLLPLDGGTAVIPSQPGGGGGDNPPPVGNQNAMLVGAAGANSNGSDFDALDLAAGPFTIRRVYEDPATGFNWPSWSACRGGQDVGKRATAWSCKPDILKLGKGSYDAKITSFVQSIPDTHVAFLTCWHEVDAKIRKGSTDSVGTTITLANWLPAIQHFCNAVHAAGKPHVYTMLALTVWSGIHPAAGSTYADTWPGGGYVDVFAVDGYSDVGSGSALWGPAVTFAQAQGVPWAVAEAGCSGTMDTTWMQNQVDYADTHAAGGQHTKAAFFCWFSSTVGGVLATPGTDPTAVAKSKQISQAHYTDVNSYLL
jgi:hypothetical protein